MSDDPMVSEALRWLAVLQDRDATAADRQAFDAWLAQGPAQAAAWQRARQVWSRAGIAGPALRARREPWPSRRQLLRYAAGTAVVAAGGYALARNALGPDHRTGPGERRTIALPDGSTVELASASALSVAYDRVLRRLTLHRGEAFFQVSAYPNWPFVVAAADGQAEARGTAFDVKCRDDDAVVTVTEHAVEVSVTGGGRATVAAGQQVRYGRGRIGPVAGVDAGLATAWRRDRLIFRDAPLGDVVAELERQRRGRIVITDDRLRTIPVTAVFDARQTDAALQTIAGTLPVRLTRVTDLLVLLSPRA